MSICLLETGKFISLLKIIWKKYYFIIDWLDRIYINSQTHRLIKVFWEGVKINFRYSFLGKISEIKKEDNSVILDNSRFVRWLINQCKACRQKIINCLTTSTFIASAQEIKKELYYLPIKTISIIVVIAVLTNIFFSIILSEEIGLLGWIIRVLFLFIGLGGLFCNADWKTIEDGSFVLRYINNACKIRDQI